MTPYPITALALRTALGDTEDAHVRALWGDDSGLAARDDGLADWYGALRPTPLPPLPDALAAHDTRQTRLCAALVGDLSAAIAAAIARWGPDRVGVAIGTTTGGIADTEAAWPHWREHGVYPDGAAFPDWLLARHELHLTADVIAALSGAAGPCLVQSSACASSAKVLGTARRWLDAGVVDAVITGGVDTACRFTLLGFGGLGILSKQRTRPFGLDRDGINLGEGGALLLVERDGAPRAWLHGVGETSDAWHPTQPRPDGAGLAEAMRQALAGLDPAAVDLVNAHATGTPANDEAEAAALAEVLPHGPWVVATKPLTGHTLGAAGAIEAALTVLCLEQGLVPATRTAALDPALPPVRLARSPTAARLRLALSTSAAFGGHNAAVALGAP
jgi:3-oxoacyl-[acyl-carrier-protein] synthase-1